MPLNTTLITKTLVPMKVISVMNEEECECVERRRTRKNEARQWRKRNNVVYMLASKDFNAQTRR